MPLPPRAPALPILTLRLTAEEATALTEAAAALRSSPSALVQSGIVDAAHRLGLAPSATATSPSPPSTWSDAPRRTATTATRISVSLDSLSAKLLIPCALYLGTSRSLFAVGATLRYIGNLQHPRASPLARVPVPAQYRRS